VPYGYDRKPDSPSVVEGHEPSHGARLCLLLG